MNKSVAIRVPTWLWVAWQHRPVLSTHARLAVRLDVAEVHGNEDGLRLGERERDQAWWRGYAAALKDGTAGLVAREQVRQAGEDAKVDRAADEAIEAFRDLRRRIDAGPGRGHLRVISGGAA